VKRTQKEDSDVKSHAYLVVYNWSLASIGLVGNICTQQVLELIIINYNMYGLICNKYILYNELSNYTRNEVIKFRIGFIICHEK
jgi:hypothetical protein